MAFATVQDLEARWRVLTDAEQERAAVLLEDAATMLSAMMAQSGVEIDPEDEAQAKALNMVSCAMVQRVMSVDEDIYGVTKGSMTADVYSQTWTYDNPTGDMYVKKQEKDLLGITGAYITTIRPVIWGEHAVD